MEICFPNGYGLLLKMIILSGLPVWSGSRGIPQHSLSRKGISVGVSHATAETQSMHSQSEALDIASM